MAKAAAATSRPAPRVSVRTKTRTGPRVALAMVRPPATAPTSVRLCIRPPGVAAAGQRRFFARRVSARLEVADEPDDVIRDEATDGTTGVDTDQDATLGVQHETSGLQKQRIVVDEGAGCLGHLANIGAMAD